MAKVAKKPILDGTQEKHKISYYFHVTKPEYNRIRIFAMKAEFLESFIYLHDDQLLKVTTHKTPLQVACEFWDFGMLYIHQENENEYKARMQKETKIRLALEAK